MCVCFHIHTSTYKLCIYTYMNMHIRIYACILCPDQLISCKALIQSDILVYVIRKAIKYLAKQNSLADKPS